MRPADLRTDHKRIRRLFLETALGLAIPLISSRPWERRKPGFSPYRPEFVGRFQLIGRIQGTQVHFDFIPGAGKDGRAAAGTEKPAGIVACFSFDCHCLLREDGGSMEQGSVMLATVEAMAKADPVGFSRRHKSQIAAAAAASETIHAVSPPQSSQPDLYNERRRRRNCPVCVEWKRPSPGRGRRPLGGPGGVRGFGGGGAEARQLGSYLRLGEGGNRSDRQNLLRFRGPHNYTNVWAGLTQLAISVRPPSRLLSLHSTSAPEAPDPGFPRMERPANGNRLFRTRRSAGF